MSARPTPRWVAPTATGVAAVLVAACLGLALLGGTKIVVTVLTGAVPFGLSFFAVGLLITTRRPQNAIGLLFLATGILFLMQGLLDTYADDAYKAGVHLPIAAYVANPTQWIFSPALMLGIVLPALRFPDGDLTPRGRWLSRCGWAAIVLTIAAFVTQPGRLLNYPVTNPLGVTALRSVDTVAEVVWILLYGAAIIGAVVSVIGRYRRSHAALRAQMRWFLYGVAIVAVGQVVAVVFTLVTNDAGPALLTLLAIPICMGIAILRYRLYDIDRVVSRTVSYAVVSGVLILVYLGLITLMTDALAFSSSFGVAASTLAAAALFQPLRRRVQAAVDRRFNRARYDSAHTVDAFAVRLRDEVDFASVRTDLLDVVSRTMEPAHASVWIAP